MTRTDLLSLTPDALAALANRGLVKRAAKDLDAGNGPEIAAAADGGVEGTFPDGTRTSLPAGAGLDAAACTCAATGACRHRICLVLAYQAAHAGADPAGPAEGGGDAPAPAAPDLAADWTPGAFDDDALARVLGQRALTAARRTLRSGYSATIRRPTPQDPVAQVELPSCTVRFLVPSELGYVHTDAVAAVRGAATVLAVWAFREADERGLTAAEARVDVGGTRSGTADSTLDAAVELADQVLMEGAVHAGPVLATGLRRTAAELSARDLHWPAAAVDDLADQLAAYHERRADHDPARFAALLAELHARRRASRAAGAAVPRTAVLGTDEAAETPLRRVRLAALGCRVGGSAGTRTADVYLAHAATGIVLVLKRRWDVPDGDRLTGADLAGRRILGASLRSLAAANVVSESATRSAGRVVRVTAGRIAKTTVTPLGGAWDSLPAGLRVTDLESCRRALEALPPRLVRPRVEAEFVRVLEIAEVLDVGYHPGAQRLVAEVADASGRTAIVSADYSPHRPAALDALAAALPDAAMIAGSVRRDRGGLVVDPFAVRTADGATIVPDLAPGDGSGALDAPAPRTPDALAATIDAALEVTAEAAHRGLAHAPPTFRDRVARAAGDLRGAGLRAAADTLADLAAALGGDDAPAAARAWATAQIRLLTTAELR
ncbi:hypothetical protein [Actinomadura algeriensis]|uniref:SWIM-type domain-containing protein n=1 Tax=Actinomadura algeriensis TaxID=1679523 RepID=A0ABR9K2Z8_9ACTN|nr:hypothetical protein [Actinomadura algeriensis]MBE1537229.1 hypothetical protein [Actinomadura algeriensis]